MRQDDYSPKQTAAMKARVRRMRDQYRRRLIAAMVIFFILGAVAGVFAHRWYVDRTPTDTLTVTTPEPTPQGTDKDALLKKIKDDKVPTLMPGETEYYLHPIKDIYFASQPNSKQQPLPFLHQANVQLLYIALFSILRMSKIPRKANIEEI